MKFQILIRVFCFVIALSTTNCVKDEVAIPSLECTQANLTVNRTVEDVRASADAIVAQYKFDDIIEAYVVSSDEHGNFFKSISFQTLATATQPAIGFSVPVDVSNTYIDYRLGNKVYLKLKDQYTDIFYGGLRIGNIFVNSFNEGGVGRLSQNDYKKVLNASCTTVSEAVLTKSIALSEVLNDKYLNTLVELSDVQFSAEAIGRHFYESSNDVGGGTNWNLEDKLGNKLFFRTSSYADFASGIVPSGSGKVKGILTKFGTDYQLVARSEKDVSLAGKRNAPFFAENFETIVANTNINLAGWSNIVQKGSLYWKGSVYSGNGCAEYAISGTKVASNVGWLISPKIDLDAHTGEILTFRAAQHHLDVDSPFNSLDVFISNNFDGVNISSANWIPLKANLPTQATPWYQFVGSGGIDLSSYKGKVNIAFRYTGSGKTLTLDGAFQIDDVQIYGEK
jgi:Family of unknown function (DUF5689)